MEELLRDQEILNTIASLSSEEFDALKSTLPYDERFALESNKDAKKAIRQAANHLNKLLQQLLK